MHAKMASYKRKHEFIDDETGKRGRRESVPMGPAAIEC